MSNISHASPGKERPANRPKQPPTPWRLASNYCAAPVCRAPNRRSSSSSRQTQSLFPPSQRPGAPPRAAASRSPTMPDDLFRPRSSLSRHRGGCAEGAEVAFGFPGAQREKACPRRPIRLADRFCSRCVWDMVWCVRNPDGWFFFLAACSAASFPSRQAGRGGTRCAYAMIPMIPRLARAGRMAGWQYCSVGEFFIVLVPKSEISSSLW